MHIAYKAAKVRTGGDLLFEYGEHYISDRVLIFLKLSIAYPAVDRYKVTLLPIQCLLIFFLGRKNQ